MKNIISNKENKFMLEPQTFTETMDFANLICKSDLVPKELRGRPADVVLVLMAGRNVGLNSLMALKNISSINGRTCIWGDTLKALCARHADCESIEEAVEGEGDKRSGICRVKRKGWPEHISTFSISDAKKAKLWGKAGPWTQYPDRMLQMRARGFALRDVFADALCGLDSAEEVTDYPSKKPSPGRIIEEYEKLANNDANKDDMICTLEDLIIALEVDNELISKWFSKANANTFDEMSCDQLSKCIEFLEKRK